MADANLTAARLRECVHYDPETGAFTRKIRLAHRHQVGDDAAHPMSHGYMRVAIDNKRYLAHRVAWLYMHGEWPRGDIDHIDGNRANNRISNLRDVDHSTNIQNIRAAKSNSRSKLLGAFCNNFGTWYSRIKVKEKMIYLGTFPSAEKAHAAFLAAKREFHDGNTL